MKLKRAVRVGKDCGLENIAECIRNIEIHATNLFPYDKIDEELNEMMLDINKISKEYGIDEEDVLNWTIKEVELYV